MAAGSTGAGGMRLQVAADPIAVRAALESVLGGLSLAGVPADDCAMAEILLAEVLNNIVEHAYEHRGGWIGIETAVDPGPDGVAAALRFTVRDWGRPMPGGAPPDGTLPAAKVGDPAEGGFGWHLIRALASRLDYAREGGCNCLQFSLNMEQKPAIR